MRRPPPSRTGQWLLLAAFVLAIAGAVVGLTRDAQPTPGQVPFVPTPAPLPSGQEFSAFPDPFAWSPGREADFVQRAARGAAHPLYDRSPGGVDATAARTTVWRPLVERAADAAGVDPDLVEGMVFLESAGRPDAMAPGGLDGAVGLTQILAETAQNLLGLHVDVPASERLTRQIGQALRRGKLDRARALAKRRRVVDERFDPAKALEATGRYLALANERFGRDDLAVVSYHMGMGNLDGVLGAYGERDVSWAQVYFDSTPATHPDAQQRMAALGDDSANYFWKVLAAREIMRLYREDRPELDRRIRLQTAKASAEEVLHPPEETEQFATPAALSEAWRAGKLHAFPDVPRVTGLRRHGSMGELAARVDAPPSLYAGLRPEALALALYIGAEVRNAGGGTLTITSTVRDQRYQEALGRRNIEATRRYSLHTTGWAFDVLREYGSRRQALAFQWVLDRLQALDVIAWVREPAAIHITVSSDAKVLLPLLDRLSP